MNNLKADELNNDRLNALLLLKPKGLLLDIVIFSFLFFSFLFSFLFSLSSCFSFFIFIIRVLKIINKQIQIIILKNKKNYYLKMVVEMKDYSLVFFLFISILFFSLRRN